MAPLNSFGVLALAFAHAIQQFLNWLAERRRKAAEAENQRSRDALADDPADWFDDHFGGVQPDAAAGTRTETDAPDTQHHQDA